MSFDEVDQIQFDFILHSLLQYSNTAQNTILTISNTAFAVLWFLFCYYCDKFDEN